MAPRHRALPGVLALLLALATASALRVSPSERLRETPLAPLLKPSPSRLDQEVPIVQPPTRTAGYFKLDRTHDARMFYFFFQARRTPSKAPVVLWMTGGPGCSSELAVLYENGPYSLNKAGTALEETEFGWDVMNNMIFVDQPIGSGFSFSEDDADTVYGEAGVAEDMLDFLYNFYAAHPELAHLPLFITGESYAGHYVPAVSHRVWLANKNKEGPRINLQGLAVGNGLTEPSTQFNAYGDYALDNGLISSFTRGWMSLLFPLCRLANSWCEGTNWDMVCAIGQQYCMMTQFSPVLAANPGINVYDITRKCEGQLCYDFSAADKFLNTREVHEALGVPPGLVWQSCSPDVYMNFAGDWLHRFDNLLPDMMADGVRVMIYAGDLDLICNWLGNRRWVDSLDWAGSEDWDIASDVEWDVRGQPAGAVKAVGPLSFVRVYKAGHMVPMDQPLNSLAMITAWTRNASLAHYTLPASVLSGAGGYGDDSSDEPVAVDVAGAASVEKVQAGAGDAGAVPPQQQHKQRVITTHFMRRVVAGALAKAAGARDAVAAALPARFRLLRRAW